MDARDATPETTDNHPAEDTGYRAPHWLPGGHAQTIHAAAWAHRPSVSYSRERWETPDRDFIDLDWVDNPQRVLGIDEHDASPLIVLFHGLEGSSNSHYARALMHAADAQGWRSVVVHFRGCSGELNRLPRVYHSGDSAEIDWILRRLRAMRSAPICAVGVSLGGNALLKWLGEQGDAALSVIDRAVAVSAPVDLTAAGDALGRGFNMLYTRHFLASMKQKTWAKLKRYPKLCDVQRMRRARTLREFDDTVTAPLHGFKNVDDYWTRASSKPWLKSIVVPTLMLNARNDPFLPERALPAPHEVSRMVRIEFPRTGGHVGFVRGPFPGNVDWLPQRIVRYLHERIS